MFDFLKKKEKKELPHHFAIISLTDEAKENGIDDDDNKIIRIIKSGEKIEEIPYTKEIARAITEIEEIPIIDEKEVLKDEDFEFLEIEEFGEVTVRR